MDIHLTEQDCFKVRHAADAAGLLIHHPFRKALLC